MSRAALTATLAGACFALLGGAGCGKSSSDAGAGLPAAKGGESHAAQRLGFPILATKNTIRVGGGDAVADAAAVALAVYPPSAGTQNSPPAVTLVDASSWQNGVAAAVLMAPPLRAPLLLTESGKVPAATNGALSSLKPTGSPLTGGAQVVLIAKAAKPSGYKTTVVAGRDDASVAAQIDRLRTTIAGKPSTDVLVTSSEQPAFAMPAAGWAAKSGNPVLYVTHDGVPPATRAALVAHQKPNIYVLGPTSAVSVKVLTQLSALGKVTRIQGPNPAANSVAFARYANGSFGWGAVDPGHGLVFASANRPLDAAVAAPLSASGSYGPLLVTTSSDPPPAPLVQYLLDIQPGYTTDPVRGVYNRAWLIGDTGAISQASQARIDMLLEIVHVSQARAPSSRPPG